MKLKTFNEENLPKTSKGSSKLYINSKNGCMHLTRKACAFLQLEEGDKLEFHQSEEDAQEWFISKGKKGFALRNKKKDDPTFGLILNNASLARLIFDSVDYNQHTGSCFIGKEPNTVKAVDYWPLITASLKSK